MELLEKYFDTAFAAPGGINKLRKLILTLAMQGKLIPQDPNDPPARDLLEEIEAEKLQLIKEKKIKASKPLPKIKPEEVPYELPEGWEWVRLIEIGSWAIGSGFPLGIQGDQRQEIFLCKVSDMNISGNEKYIESVNNTISEELAHKHKINIHESGTIIFPKIGGAIATNKRRILTRRTAIDNNCLGIKPYSQIYLEWVYQLLLSFDFSNYQAGTSVPAISQGVIGEIVIGLPPSPEQHRIVAKIDQLMARLNEIEKLQAKREQKRLTAHRSVLNHLLMATESDDFRDAWRFTSQHFGELYSVGDTITDLRKAILQLAVMGKLIPQDPNDPPARDLLEEIEAEKLQLIKEKKIKASKPLPKIKPEEVPYELPEGWEWVMLGDLNPEYQNGISKRNSNHGTETIVLRLADIIDNEVSLEGTRGIRLTDEEREKYLLNNGDILVTRVNGSADLVGSFIRVRNSQFPLAYCDHFIRMRLPLDLIDVDYLHVVSKSALIRRQIEKKHVTTAGQRTVNQTHITTLALPIPPLPEQHRIVAKINKLMILCGTLEEKIDTENGKQSAMLDAVLAAVYRELDIKSH